MAERFPLEVIRRQNAVFQSSELLAAVLDNCPCLAAALNSRRQIVYSNRAMLDYVGAKEIWQVLGKRTGEALECMHACEAEGGCGTTEACRYCGALRVMREALDGKAGAGECRITRVAAGQSLDLSVSAAPVTVEGERFVTLAIEDISHEKRRRALERIFFHDVMNTAGAVRGLADVLVERVADGAQRLAQTLRSASHQLVAEIATQRTLLGRVLDNMVKNAFEASRAGERIVAGCRQAGGEIEFWVRNPAVMPRDVQLQVFQRSFSTKGAGRGLGTYSMRLLTVRYLGGAVSFSSEDGEGTEFRARYPRALR